MQFREATLDDVQEIVELINVAYRGKEGWTTENALVDGDRTTSDEVLGYLYDPKSHLFVLVENSVKAVICVEEQNSCAYIGFFAVNPNMQGKGAGKVVLQKAEEFTVENLGVKEFVMSVLVDRVELVDFYIRRGYLPTNEIKEYPKGLNVGTPKQELKVITLKKSL